VVQGGSTTTALAGGLSWVCLVLAGLVRAAGVEVPRPLELAAGLIASPVALAAALQSAAAAWRGPTLVAFTLGESVPLSAAEAAFVRSVAQLRGLMGGGGHVHPRRQVFPAVAWAAAGLGGVAALVEGLGRTLGPWPVVLAAVAAFVALLFPSRAYFYRDTTGGGAILSPPSAGFRLKRRAQLAGSLPAGAAPTPPPAAHPALGRVSNEPGA
jgi:hypothetical protein